MSDLEIELSSDLFDCAELVMFRESHSIEELCYTDLIAFLEEKEEEQKEVVQSTQLGKGKDESVDYEDEVFEE